MGLLPLSLLPKEADTLLLIINGLIATALNCKPPDGIDYKEPSFVSIFTLDWHNLAFTHLPLIKILTLLFSLMDERRINGTEGCPKQYYILHTSRFFCIILMTVSITCFIYALVWHLLFKGTEEVLSIKNENHDYDPTETHWNSFKSISIVSLWWIVIQNHSH